MDKTQKNKDMKEEGRARTGALHFDYKNTALLERYVNQHSRIHGRRRTQLTGREQRLLAQAMKRARFMALMPFVAR